MPPSYLVSHTFLGKPCGKGINPVLQQRLIAVEQELESMFDQLPDDERIDPITGEPVDSYISWCGLSEPIIGWRSKASYHSSGSACDFNYTTNPYIATRSPQGEKTVYGGEAAGASLQTVRQQATEVYDRAMQFIYTPDYQADVSARQPEETTSDVYDRFSAASEALRGYLRFALATDSVRVNRKAISSVEQASADDLLQLIPEPERLSQEFALSLLRDYMESSDFQDTHPDWPYTPEEQFDRILRDYELVRIPMVFGTPSARPDATRNPAAYGFLNLRKELVISLCDTGQLRWGACDLGVRESGDIQHFDLGSDGGYPREN